MKKLDIEEVVKRYSAAKKDKEKWVELWDKYMSKFNGGLLYKREEWQSDISSPELYKAVTKMTGMELKRYWGKKYWELEAVRPEDKGAVKRQDRLLEIQIMGDRGRMKKWLRGTVHKYLEGPCIVKMYWGDGSPVFDPIDPRYVFPEPGAETVEEAEYVCHEVMVSKDYVRKMFEDGVFKTGLTNPEDANVTVDETGVETTDWDEVESMLAGQGDVPKGMENDNRDQSTKANLIEYWQDDRVITVLNKKFIVRDQENPFEHGKKPFLFNICMDSWNAIWGCGLAWNTYNIYDKLDRHTNMRLDLARLLMNPPVWWGTGAGVFSDPVMKISPGKIYKVSRNNETAQFNFNGALDANNVAVQLLQSMGEETTAITRGAQGIDTPSANDTAMGAATMAQAGADRIELYMMQNDDFAVKFVEMWMQLNKQFLMQPDSEGNYASIPIKVESEGGIGVEELTREDLDIKADIIIRAPGQSQNKLAAQQNEIQLYGMLKGDPEIDHKASLRGLLEAFERDVEEYMLSDDEKVKNVMEQMLLQQTIAQATQPQMPSDGAPGNMTQAPMMNNTDATAGVAQ
jgi:hypothetical protein